MIVGIMQPYFVPYIGYWQLLNAVDKYVIYDDVNFIKGGWINRNRILINEVPKYFNIPMLGASPNKLINEIKVNNDERIISKNLRILHAAYNKAPFFDDVYPLLEKILWCKEDNIANYLSVSILEICTYLEIKTELLMSSELAKDNSLTGQDKVLEICKILGATDYYNAIGGKSLYSFEKFKEVGIELHFLERKARKYQQFGNDFHSDLSIIDVMMFNSKKTINEMLGEYTLISSESAERLFI